MLDMENENTAEQANGNPGAQPKKRRRRSRRKNKDGKPKRNVPWPVDLAVGLLIALLISAGIKAFIMQPFVIPSESMEDTLLIRDHILVSKLPFALTPVRRGDIVVFEDRNDWLPPEDKSPKPTGFKATAFGQGLDQLARIFGLLPEYSDGYLVKRVIGVGGDKIRCCNDLGQIEVNGKAVEENYLKKDQQPYPMSFKVTVPEGKIWVQGDNRNNSSDSRFHQQDRGQGFIDLKYVTGRVFFRYYPLNRIGVLSNPGNFE